MLKYVFGILTSIVAIGAPIVKDIDTINSPSGTITLSAIPNGPVKASSGVMSASPINLTTEVTGVLPVANGGTGSSSGYTFSSPLVNTAGTISIPQATNAVNGYLSFTDWITFNGKQNALTFGNLTDVGTDGITITNGSNAVIGAGTSIAQQKSDATHNGYLSSGDWSTFNNKQSALTFGSISTSTTGVTVGGGANSTVGPNVTVNVQNATGSQPGLLTAADWTTFNNKQNTLTPGHDFWIDRNGSDSNNCSIAAPCQTVGYALTLVISPSSTNNYTIHLLSGRHDQETGDLLLQPYTWIVGNGGPDVGSYLRLPAGKAIKLGSGWTSNGRGGIQSVYLGGGTSINLDFAGVGGSAGSNFMLDDVFVTGTFTHTGRGINGGDFLYIQNSLIFGAASLTGSELQSLNSTWAGNVTLTTSATVNCDATFIGGQVDGNLSFTQTGSATGTFSTGGTTYVGTFTTVGTVGLTADSNLPPGYSLSGGTTITKINNAFSHWYTPTIPGNWSPAPTQVGAALDQLASRVPATGAVSSISVATANGLNGSSSGGTTPVLTLGTTISGVLKGNGTAISAAVAGTDYQAPLTFGNLTDVGTDGITVTGGTGAVIGSGTSLSQQKADATHNGYLASADWSTFNNKQATLTPGHDFWIDRNGSDSNNCSIAAPCQTVGYALTLVSSPSSTNNYTIHLLSGRHDQETGDLLLQPYTWIVGNGGPDVGSYLRLPAGKAIKLGSGWTSNGRGGIQSVYLGGGTSINLDFVAAGGSAGSNFMLDDVFVTGTFTHTGRGVNGGDFLYIQNTFVFGAASFTGSELQSLNSTWGSTVTMTSSSTVNMDATFIGGQVAGNLSFTQTGSATASLSVSGTTYTGTFTTTGTVALTADDNLPIGYSLSGGTTKTNLKNAGSLAYSPATPGNWSPSPSLVNTALDQLASRVPSGGAVSSVSVVSANGFAGSSSGGTTPALTLSTTVTGLLKGNSTAISAAVANTDYLPATSGSAIQKANGSGGLTAAVSGTDYQAPINYAQEVPSGLINGSNTAFTLAHTPTNSLNVSLYLDGIFLRQGTDYTISGANITMTAAPVANQTIDATYNY